MKATNERSSTEFPGPFARSGAEAHRDRKSDTHENTHWWKAACAEAALPVLMRCFQRIRTWRLPPNWSASDWFEEVKEVLCVAAIEADADFDPARGVSVGAFLYHRAMSRVLTRYRQEWNYGTRFVSECAGRCADADEAHNSQASSGRTDDPFLCAPEPDKPLEELTEALASMSAPSRRLIELLFWEERTESEAAREFGISQPAICKRLQAVLSALHRRVVLRK